MNDQECKIKPVIMAINSDEPSFYPYSVEINKCSGSCISTNGSYDTLCVPDVVRNTNVRVFNLISRTHERRHIECHESCQCKCRLDASVCNNKQRWNDDKCRCESKELIDRGRCDEGFIWNASNCKCECDKSCDVDGYFDYNCKCKL